MEPSVTTSSERFLTFRVDAQLYALRAAEVSEVIRTPALTRIPQGPSALLGLANLRGSVLPVASLRELLKKPAQTGAASERAIVLDVGYPVAIVVDAVETLVVTEENQIETRKKELSAAGSEKLIGAFSIGNDKSVAKILDIKALLQAAFANYSRTERQVRKTIVSASSEGVVDAKKTEVLVTFEVAGQEFALPLNVVQEILTAPPSVTAVAQAEAVVLGVVAVRDTLLPLLSLRGLLGFVAAADSEQLEKIVVVNVAGAQVGLVADRARAIVVADCDDVDPVPPVLAARTGGESRIRSIYRGEQGRRLISILSPDQLFHEDVMQRLIASHSNEAHRANAASRKKDVEESSSENRSGAELIFLVFRLGDDEFGLPIETVVEVAQVPEQITRVPKTPKFLEGVINLRGDVLPVVDQRRRFDMPKLERTEGRRLVVMKTERHRAGLIVDSVSDVLRTSPDDIEPPPNLDDATTRLVRGVINLEKSKRMVLVLDPAEMLTRAEQTLLDTFEVTSKKANA